MAKRLTPAQAKAARQKKIVIVLAVVFALVCAIQVPKLMKQLNPKPPVDPGATAAPATSTSTPGVPTAAATPAATPGVAPTPAATSQLHNFSHFSLKDPFHALVVVKTVGAAGTDAAAAPDVAAAAQQAQSKAAAAAKKADAKAAAAAKAAANAPASGTVGFVAAVAPPNAAVVKMNGHKQIVFVGDGFPSKNPLFKLVALGEKTIRVGVFGGSFTQGAPTIKLAKGKQVTLANQADGSHYVIELVKLTSATKPVATTPKAPAAQPNTASTTG